MNRHSLELCHQPEEEEVRKAEMWRAVYWRLVNIELGAGRFDRTKTPL